MINKVHTPVKRTRPRVKKRDAIMPHLGDGGGVRVGNAYGDGMMMGFPYKNVIRFSGSGEVYGWGDSTGRGEG